MGEEHSRKVNFLELSFTNSSMAAWSCAVPSGLWVLASSLQRLSNSFSLQLLPRASLESPDIPWAAHVPFSPVCSFRAAWQSCLEHSAVPWSPACTLALTWCINSLLSTLAVVAMVSDSYVDPAYIGPGIFEPSQLFFLTSMSWQYAWDVIAGLWSGRCWAWPFVPRQYFARLPTLTWPHPVGFTLCLSHVGKGWPSLKLPRASASIQLTLVRGASLCGSFYHTNFLSLLPESLVECSS